MKSYIQFVTVPTGDTPGTCIMLHHDNRRYLFGHIGEGTTRACNELKLSLRKVQKLFIAGRTNRETTGGLLGMLLTLADANASASVAAAESAKPQMLNKSRTEESQLNIELEVYGPPNLVHSVAAARKFIFRKNTPTKMRDLEDEPPQKNEKGDWLPTVMDMNTDIFALVTKPSGQDQGKEVTDLTGDDLDEESKNVLRQHVITEMFNSKWRLDTLVETYLKDVKLPAKIWVRSFDSKDLELYEGPLPGGSEPIPNPYLKVYVRNPWPASSVVKLPRAQQKPDAVSYIARGRITRGKFDRKKAVALGVPPGPMFSKLTAGESVTLTNGTVVASHQVMGPAIQTGGFALFDLPSEEYVEPLLAKEELATEKVMAGVDTFVWLLGTGVSSNQALQKFIHDNPKVQHIVSSPDHNTNMLVAHGAASSAIKLAQLDGDHFRVPYFDNATTPSPNFRRESGFWSKEAGKGIAIFSLPNVMLAQRGLTVQLDPQRDVRESDAVPPLDTDGVVTSSQLPEVMSIAKEVHQSALTGPLAQELAHWNTAIPMQDAEIITLGTGSAMPSRYRNVSATLVRVPGWGSYLLDAGESTMGQLQRVYKPHELVDVLKDLRMIWISHGHADHHLGTVSVIKAWYDVVHGRSPDHSPMTPTVAVDLLKQFENYDSNLQPVPLTQRPKYLAVMGNVFLLNYLRELSEVEDFGFSHVIPIDPLSPSGPSNSQANAVFKGAVIKITGEEAWASDRLTRAQMGGLLGLKAIKAVNVKHCNAARAIFLEYPNKFSVAYSGDCRPSSTFAQVAKNATVLIHEATFDDDLQGEARAKKHSTVQEAIGVASLMRAKSLILTHFSQRYQKIPVLDNIWGKTEEVRRQIERETAGDDTVVAKGPGAGDDVDEIAADAEEVSTAVNSTSHGEIDDTDEMEAESEEEDVGPDALDSTVPRKMPILFAFDYMRVRVGDIPKLQAYRPAFAKLFEEDIEELEKRLAKAAANAVDAALRSPKRQGSVKKSKEPKVRKVQDGNSSEKDAQTKQLDNSFGASFMDV